MKTFVMKNYTHNVTPTPTPRNKIPNSKLGWFNYDYDTDNQPTTFTLTFKPFILLDPSISATLKKQVLDHERVHESDFHTLARRLNDSLTAAFKKSDDVDMDNWMDWFKYDIDQAANNYHRSIGADLDVTFRPSKDRPQ